ncbi:YggT family protein [Bifidobacterium vespertilionis]|uniref:YggT family protein n=1 Tax=Bifidobacterium vespertilionis TaxID=2562524 RepID=A0A5J5DT54_9BIFI|nr:YggT family protein [Bifidobacterium vespertilionis]KAA8816891.1 YggT family protein [Bifidobacterium vespertilionis]KAA8821890.1 YggT family protein [Bifidobacterium vespertilionis]MBT1180362.1 YggT family protein [Bifidobacterium vespertilionis]
MLLYLIRSIIDLLIDAYMLILFIRMILDWVSVLSPRWYPRGVVSTLVAAVYNVTEPPLRWLRRYIRPIPMGPMYFDVSFMVLWFGLIVLRMII